MDIIAFQVDSSNPTKLLNAHVVNGLTSKTWIERHSSAGEFTLKAPATEEIRSLLPLNSIISHTETGDIMIVESHEINDNGTTTPEITITGRGFETYLDNRIVGANQLFPGSLGNFDYTPLGADYSWNQAVQLIKDHTYAANLYDDSFAIPYFTVSLDSDRNTTWYDLKKLVGVVPAHESRPLKRGGVYTRLLELLAIDNLGLMVSRPGSFSPISDSTNQNISLRIFYGNDVSKSVVFSTNKGDIIDADYLWSIKGDKNCALVSSTWIDVVVTTSNAGYNKRMMFVDASSVDSSFTTLPVGPYFTAVVTRLNQLGREALAKQNKVTINKVTLANNLTTYKYRSDYNLGDIVMVHGDYSTSSKMRVVEYVETEDSTGCTGTPTLALI